jgi:hypothetical protein
MILLQHVPNMVSSNEVSHAELYIHFLILPRVRYIIPVILMKIGRRKNTNTEETRPQKHCGLSLKSCIVKTSSVKSVINQLRGANSFLRTGQSLSWSRNVPPFIKSVFKIHRYWTQSQMSPDHVLFCVLTNCKITCPSRFPNGPYL